MTRAALFVYTSPVSTDVETEFDDWYDTVHIPQVVARVDGITGGRRFVMSEVQMTPKESAAVRRRLTIYEVDAEDLTETLAELAKAMRDGSLDNSATVDRAVNPPEVVVYEPIDHR